jgi:hypothetical protein
MWVFGEEVGIVGRALMPSFVSLMPLATCEGSSGGARIMNASSLKKNEGAQRRDGLGIVTFLTNLFVAL